MHPSSESAANVSIEQLAALLPVIDLTDLMRCGSDRLLSKSTRIESSVEQAARHLFRSTAPHILISGESGVGKTSLVYQLAQKAAHGDPEFLTGSRFISIDCCNVGVEDSRACLESIITTIFQLSGQIVLCVEGLANLLKRPNGGTNNPLLRAMLDRPDLRMIGVMSDWEFTEFVASDSRMLESFSRIEVSEPGNSETLKIVQQHATSLSQEFSLTISKHVVSRTVALASSFILNECHPAKSIRLLRQVCEDAEFDRTQLGQARDSIELRQVVDAIAEKTGIPAETIGGEEGESDFDSALRDAVVGQNEAVGEVAKELGLIKAGLSEPAKPATVLLFAGLTGVGKSELAKRIAELYSTSRRLQAYAMGNFTEPHSVSGIIGVPPGYVGHEDGGRLINELNADPYSVFLLDEAEKCHPNIWKPFLNLFDEGWIVDQRGRKAYADRAVFILTTNAGDRHIAQMAKSGSSPEQTAEKIKQVLSKVRHERSSQPVFPPQFLSRIKRIIVFKPLTEEAMIGITERVCRRMNGRWEQKREKKILVNVEVIEAIGRHAHELNQKSNGQEGGRVVQKLVGDLIERAVQEAASANKNGYLAASEIHAELSCDTPQGSVPEVKIRFGCTQDATEAIK